jgi:hypothetical protein
MWLQYVTNKGLNMLTHLSHGLSSLLFSEVWRMRMVSAQLQPLEWLASVKLWLAHVQQLMRHEPA